MKRRSRRATLPHSATSFPVCASRGINCSPRSTATRKRREQAPYYDYCTAAIPACCAGSPHCNGFAATLFSRSERRVSLWPAGRIRCSLRHGRPEAYPTEGRAPLSAKGMLRARKIAVAHLLAVTLRRLHDRLPHLRITLGEARPQFLGEAEQVGRDEDLPVAACPGADADGRDLDGLRDLEREVGGNTLDDDGKDARLLHGQRVFQKPSLVALHAEAAEAMNRLRRQSDVPHHGNVRLHDGPDRLD